MTLPSQAVLFCGGRGTRLKPLTDNLPKPMAPVLGRPFLEYLVGQLREAGVQKLLLLTGYRGDQIANYFGDGGRFGISISYHHGPEEWETGQRLAEASQLLDPRFLLFYGDNLAPIQLHGLAERHHESQCPLTITVAAKATGNIRLGTDGRVAVYDSARTQSGLTHVEIGYMIAERDPVLAKNDPAASFSRTLAALASDNQVSAFDPGAFYHSISDLDRLRLTEAYVQPKKILLVDRDGVINRKAAKGEYIWKPKDFVWIPETLAGLETLAQKGFEFIIISNQAGVGRGIVPLEAVNELHAWMNEQMRKRGIRVREIYVCPHHWEDNCRCRKPLPGLFYAAAKKHQFRLDRTFYIGDDERDVLAAWRAGCPCVHLEDQPASGEPKIAPRFRFRHLGEAVPDLLACFETWNSPIPSWEPAA